MKTSAMVDIARTHNHKRSSSSKEKKYVVTDVKIGEGSYGCVFMGKEYVGGRTRDVAIKRCEIDGSLGISNIIEPCIMATIRHPNIASAIDIVVEDTYMYIVQDLAVMDLRKRCRSNLSISKLRKIFRGICEGLYFLHSLNIVHADIKPGNILLSDDDMPRITDFSLSIIQGSHPKTHTVCSPGYRPIEDILDKSWGKPLDIWSLGCTMYSITYGESLFPYQGDDISDKHNKEAKKLINERFADAILDWAKNCPGGPQPLPSNLLYRQNNPKTTFKKSRLNKKWYSSSMSEINDLILRMLAVDQDRRIKIEDILKHPFIRRREKINKGIIINTNIARGPLPSVLAVMSGSTGNEKCARNIAHAAFYLLQNKYSAEDIRDVSILMANKLYNNNCIPNYREMTDREKVIERKIATVLYFRLHNFS